jgi:hypothetical protein
MVHASPACMASTHTYAYTALLTHAQHSRSCPASSDFLPVASILMYLTHHAQHQWQSCKQMLWRKLVSLSVVSCGSLHAVAHPSLLLYCCCCFTLHDGSLLDSWRAATASAASSSSSWLQQRQQQRQSAQQQRQSARQAQHSSSSWCSRPATCSSSWLQQQQRQRQQ